MRGSLGLWSRVFNASENKGRGVLWRVNHYIYNSGGLDGRRGSDWGLGVGFP